MSKSQSYCDARRQMPEGDEIRILVDIGAVLCLALCAA